MLRTVLLTMFLSSLMLADTLIDLNFNGTDLEVSGSAIKRGGSTNAYYGFTYLNAEDEFDEQQTLLSADAILIGRTYSDGWLFGLGARAMYAPLEFGEGDNSVEKTFTGIPLQAKVLYRLPIRLQTYITGILLYGPSVLTFGDFVGYREARLEADVELFEGGMVYLGGRQIIMTPDEGDEYTFNSAGFIGLRFGF